MKFYSQRVGDRRQQLLTTPSAIFSSLIADLHHAHRSIDMEFYIFASDRTGSAIADILCRKARQGVGVRLLVDGYGSRMLSRATLQRMAVAGVRLYRQGLFGNCRNHRKMTIIDRHTAHIGGVNIADRYVVGNNLGTWHDVQLRIVGDGVETLTELFDYDVRVAEGMHPELPMPTPLRGVQLHWSEADGGRAMRSLFEDVATTAKRSIIICTPYFMPPRHAVGLLAEAVGRGVNVTIIIPERCDVWAIDNLTRRYVACAMSHGVDMQLMRGGFVHAKLAVVDGCRTILGSANLDARSLNINRELMLSTHDRGVCRAAEKFILMLHERCSPPCRSDLRSPLPSLVTRLLEPVL